MLVVDIIAGFILHLSKILNYFGFRWWVQIKRIATDILRGRRMFLKTADETRLQFFSRGSGFGFRGGAIEPVTFSNGHRFPWKMTQNDLDPIGRYDWFILKIMVPVTLFSNSKRTCFRRDLKRSWVPEEIWSVVEALFVLIFRTTPINLKRQFHNSLIYYTHTSGYFFFVQDSRPTSVAHCKLVESTSPLQPSPKRVLAS